MIADAEYNIMYVNKALRSFLTTFESEIQAELPRFSLATLVGSNIDIFHKNPAHQRGMLSQMSGMHSTSIRICKLIFGLVVNPLFNSQRQRIGTVVEWADTKILDNAGQVTAINRANAVIEFNMDGTIIKANEIFCDTMGYSVGEIVGKHHSMFADQEYKNSQEYKEFWADLNAGKPRVGAFRRYGKNNKEVWLQATYNPIFDLNGKPFKVVKFATDITAEKLSAADNQGQIEAINKVQAVIHFKPDGTILFANKIFLDAMGYSQEEVQGKHHRIFVEPNEAQSEAYSRFWKDLAAGAFASRVFKRIRKNGGTIWIQASYNPIFDMNGKVFKIVKYASDITDIIESTDYTESTVNSVAAAAEELSASIAEIAKNVEMSKATTDDIMKKADSSGQASDALVSTMQSMEKIVDLIRTIAGQVNLLALNATIEAARAGEAGKGFAVVASEVKNLANQTASATDEIAKEISNVQTITKQVAQSIKDTVESANLVGQYVTSVAGAIQEQSAATSEISSNAQKTLGSAKKISDKIKKTGQA